MIAANLQLERTKRAHLTGFLREAKKQGDAVFVTPEELEPDGPEFPEDVPPVRGTDVAGLFPSGTSPEMMAGYARTTGAFPALLDAQGQDTGELEELRRVQEEYKAELQLEHWRKQQLQDFLRAARAPGDAVFVIPEELEPDGPEFPEGLPPSSMAEGGPPSSMAEDVEETGELEELRRANKEYKARQEEHKAELQRIKAANAPQEGEHGKSLEAELRRANEEYATRELNILAAAEERKRSGRGRRRTKHATDSPKAKQQPGAVTTPKKQPGALTQRQDSGEQPVAKANKHGYFGAAFQMTPQQSGRRNDRLRGQAADSNKTLLYHQTSRDSTEKIIESGKMKVGKSGSAGGGIYFACSEQDTRKALQRGFVFMCHVKLGKTEDIGERHTWKDFHREFGTLDYKTLQTREPPVDSVALKTFSGPERVVYNSDQVELVMVRACDGANALSYTSEWHDVQELQRDPAKLARFLRGELPSDQHRVDALQRKIEKLEAQNNAAAKQAAAVLRKSDGASPVAVQPKTRPMPTETEPKPLSAGSLIAGSLFAGSLMTAWMSM
jgi:hypothetical protein